MLRNHFLMNSINGGENIVGHYDWCVKYTSKLRINPFGISTEKIKQTLISLGYTVTGDFYWFYESGETKTSVIQTYDVYDPKTKKGVFGFIGPQPKLFIAVLDVIDSSGSSKTLYAGFNGLSESLEVGNPDYNVTKIICPSHTDVIGARLCFFYSAIFHVLEEYEFPSAFTFTPYMFNAIGNYAPYLLKSFIYKNNWNVSVKLSNPFDVPGHTMNRVNKLIVEPYNTSYDSREDCGCIIETNTNALLASSTECFIPNTVTKLETYCFYQCRAPEIIIPTLVKQIDKTAFDNFEGIIKYPGTIEEFKNNITFYQPSGTHSTFSVQCLDGTTTA